MGGMGSATSGNEEEGTINQWETRFGMRVDLLAAAAYLLGPISGKYIWSWQDYMSILIQGLIEFIALLCLILETHNDYVRFHGRLPSSSCSNSPDIRVSSLSICFGDNAPCPLSNIRLSRGLLILKYPTHNLDCSHASFHGVRDSITEL